jgi:hypothetical protein
MCDKPQAVEFSTRGGLEFWYNVSRQNLWYDPKPQNSVPTTSWQWTYRDAQADQNPSLFTERFQQRGVQLRFEPKHQFPFKEFRIDSIAIPVWGMRSHVIGKVVVFIDGIPEPTIPGYTHYNQIIAILPLVGWDCQNPIEVMNKYMKIVTAKLPPNDRDIITFTSTNTGAFRPVCKYQGVNLTITFLDSYEANYTMRLERFFGRGVNGEVFTYENPKCGFDAMEFPFLRDIRLNTRLITQQISERGHCRNLESFTQTQQIASFPWGSRNLENCGEGAGIAKPFFALSPTMAANTIKSTKDFCCIQSIDFWFSYGEDDDNLYEPTLFPNFDDDPYDPRSFYLFVEYYVGGEPNSSFTFNEGPREIDVTENNGTGNPSQPRSWADDFFRRELTIYGTFNACGCATNTNDPRYFLSHSK